MDGDEIGGKRGVGAVSKVEGGCEGDGDSGGWGCCWGFWCCWLICAGDGAATGGGASARLWAMEFMAGAEERTGA